MGWTVAEPVKMIVELFVVDGHVVMTSLDILSLYCFLSEVQVFFLQPNIILKVVLRVTQGISADFQD